MKRGAKSLATDEKLAKGTLRPCREAAMVEIVEPHGLPVQPDWLTPAGQQVWLDNLGRVMSSRGATEMDSELFGTYCNLQGANSQAWRSGEVPPTTALMETRKMAELLRIAGPSSRAQKVGDGDKPVSNPFNRNGVRR